MDNIRYILGDDNLLDDLKELWEALNEHQRKVSLHFTEFYNSLNYEIRKKELLRQAQNGRMRVEICFDDASQNRVGYCVSSMDKENIGIIESIFVLPSHRGIGIGERLMQRGLRWMDEMGAVKKTVNVTIGNEQAFGFYQRHGFYPRKTTLEHVQA